MSGPWFEDPAFWDDFRIAMFHARRQAETPAEVDALVKLLGIAPPGQAQGRAHSLTSEPTPGRCASPPRW